MHDSIRASGSMGRPIKRCGQLRSARINPFLPRILGRATSTMKVKTPSTVRKEPQVRIHYCEPSPDLGCGALISLGLRQIPVGFFELVPQSVAVVLSQKVDAGRGKPAE